MARNDALLRLHERLVAKRDSLRKKLAEEFNVSVKFLSRISRGGDVGDAASDGASDEVNSQLAALESRELNQIERALQMMREGRYGMCEICEKAIPITRLNALPFTPLCIDCQRRHEQSGHSEYETHADWESAYEHEGRLNDQELTLGDFDFSE
jgi:DnaK suppressor protein